jgi:hypothetical protein
MGTLKEGDKTGPAVKTIKLLAQSTGDFTREELKKDAKLAWTDKTKEQIAAAKGDTNANPNANQGGGNTGGDNQGGGGDSGSIVDGVDEG